MSDLPSKPRDIWPVLAGLRFALALWVLFDHTYNFGPINRAIPMFTRSGLMAVLCFFVISGYSIRHSITADPGGYAGRRFWRIAPIHLLSVAIVFIAYIGFGLSGGYGTPASPPSFGKWLGTLLLLECVLPVKLPFLAPAWSLSIEVLYYALAPLIRRCRSSAVIGTFIMSCLLFIVWPWLTSLYVGDATYGFGAAAMLWAWLAGWLAHSRAKHPALVSLILFSGALGVAAQARIFDVGSAMSWAGTLCAWAATILIVFYRAEIRTDTTIARVLNYLGEVSYPLYLLHSPVLFVFLSSVLKTYPAWNRGPVQVGVALVAAVLAYHTIDAPLRKRAWLLPSPASPIVTFRA